MPGPALFPPYSSPQTTVDWPIDGAPTLTWQAPPRNPDHWNIYSNTSATSWSTATKIQTLPGSARSFTDGAASANGTGIYYWAIGFDITETIAGNSYAVCACQNAVSASTGTITGAGAISSTIPFTSDIRNPALGAPFAIVRTRATISASGVFTPGIPNVGPPAHVDTVIGQLRGSDPVSQSFSVAEVDGMSTPATNTAPDTKGAPFQTSPAPFTSTFKMTYGPGSGNWGSPGNFAQLVGLIVASAKVSYVSPPASPTFQPSSGDLGGGFGTPPGVQNSAAIALFTPDGPMPVPLPCTPCCFTCSPALQGA